MHVLKRMRHNRLDEPKEKVKSCSGKPHVCGTWLIWVYQAIQVLLQGLLMSWNKVIKQLPCQMTSSLTSVCPLLPLPVMPRQDGKVAIVTGGGRGIGYEAVRHMAKLGAHVIIGRVSSTTPLACKQDRGDTTFYRTNTHMWFQEFGFHLFTLKSTTAKIVIVIIILIFIFVVHFKTTKCSFS